MEGLFLILHILVCMFLIVIVLLQSGKSADLAGAFGGMGSQSSFGPRGRASFLSKMTTTLAILFMLTSLSLYIIAANKSGTKSVISKEDGRPVQTQSAPKTVPPVNQEQKKAEPVNTPAPAGTQPTTK